MEYTIDEIRLILKEATKMDGLENDLCDCNAEDDYELPFDAGVAMEKIRAFIGDI